MMKKAMAAILIAAATAAGAAAHDFKTGSVSIGHPWAKAAPAAAPVVGGYLKLTNEGTAEDRFVGGTSPDAERVEVHESSTTDGVARMRPLKEGIVLKPGETVELKPGGIHLMLVRPMRQFKEGEMIPVTLEFEKAGQLEVQFKVQKGVPETHGSQHQDTGKP